MAIEGRSRFVSDHNHSVCELRTRRTGRTPGDHGTTALHEMERRIAPREAVRQSVRVYYGANLGLWADCELRDLSASGVKVYLPSLYKLPTRFILLLHQTGVAYDVVLKWRRGDLAGLSFETRHDLETTEEARLATVREAWVGLRPAQ